MQMRLQLTESSELNKLLHPTDWQEAGSQQESRQWKQLEELCN